VVPAPPRRGPDPRRPGARGRVRVLSRPGRPRVVEPGHDDAPVPPVRPQGRHQQLAEGAPALLRHPAPGRGHGPEHRGRSPRPRRGLDDLEVLRHFSSRAPPIRPPPSSPPSSTASARRNASASCTSSTLLPSGTDELAVLASVIGPQAGLDEATNLAWLTEFARRIRPGS
jgi:hypothetical protein